MNWYGFCFIRLLLFCNHWQSLLLFSVGGAVRLNDPCSLGVEVFGFIFSCVVWGEVYLGIGPITSAKTKNKCLHNEFCKFNLLPFCTETNAAVTVVNWNDSGVSKLTHRSSAVSTGLRTQEDSDLETHKYQLSWNLRRRASTVWRFQHCTMRTLLLLCLCAYVAWAQDDLEFDDYETVSLGQILTSHLHLPFRSTFLTFFLHRIHKTSQETERWVEPLVSL